MKHMAEALRTKTDVGELLKDAALFREASFINGEWITGGTTLAVRNPASGEVVGTIPDLGAHETRRAIDAANAALPAWRALPAAKRSALLEAWFNAINQHMDDLAKILTVEQGIAVDIEASHPKMGFLVREAAERAADVLRTKGGGAAVG